jgi:hypothetical protein
MAYGNTEPSPDAQETTLAGTDDSGYGLVMFVVFSAVVLFVHRRRRAARAGRVLVDAGSRV